MARVIMVVVPAVIVLDAVNCSIVCTDINTTVVVESEAIYDNAMLCLRLSFDYSLVWVYGLGGYFSAS